MFSPAKFGRLPLNFTIHVSFPRHIKACHFNPISVGDWTYLQGRWFGSCLKGSPGGEKHL
jgi:hypothetical protein